MTDAIFYKDIRGGHKNKSGGSLSKNENVSSKYVKLFRKLLLLNEETNLNTALKNIQELLAFSEKIFSASAVAETFLYFCLHGAATSWILQSRLNLPEATAYRALKRLRALGIIVPALKVSKMRNSKGGPRPTVWALEGASTEEISRALRLHIRTLNPKYRIAEEAAQTILDEYMSRRNLQEISYREILIHMKELRVPFNKPDIAELAAQYLHERGIKVWR